MEDLKTVIEPPKKDIPTPSITPPLPTSSPPVLNVLPENPPLQKSSSVSALLVVLLLILLGIMAAFAVVVISRRGSPATSEVMNPLPTVQPTAGPAFDLALTSPVDKTIVVDDKITVKGKTSANTTVVIYSDTDEISQESDQQGLFEGSIPLQEGINSLTVTAFGENGEEKSVMLDVVYDPQT